MKGEKFKYKIPKVLNVKEAQINVNKKMISIMLIIIMIIHCLPISVFAKVTADDIKPGSKESGTFTQTLVASSNNLTPGKEVDISIKISNSTGKTNAYEGYIYYDTTVLKYKNSKGENGWHKLLFDDYETGGKDADGEISLSRTALDSVMAEGNIATITFEVIKDVEETSVRLYNAYMVEAAKIFITEDTELTIKEDEWTITYDVNEGDEASKPESKTENISKPMNIATQKPTKEGYEFLGWSLSKESTTAEYTPGQEVTYQELKEALNNGSTEKNITLYAIWGTKSYDIVYYWNGGESGPENTKKVHGDSYTIKEGPTKEGYEFAGWYDMVTEEIHHANDEFSEDRNLYLVAQWNATTYTITLDSNGGMLPPGESNQKNAQFQSEIDLPTPIQEGYTFKGWNNSDNLNVGSKLTVTQDETLEAQWDETIYTINYDVNGGEGVFHAQTRTIDDDDIEIYTSEPIKEGYKFTGWLSSSDKKIYSAQGNNIYSKLESSTFTAQWESIKYTITYMPNSQDVSGSIESSTKGYNNTIALSNGSGYTRQGYDFMGWAKDKNADYSAIDYIGGAQYSANEDITLYAIWKDENEVIDENKFSIKYDTQDGTPQISTQMGNKENDYEILSDIIPTKEGYTFAGWTTDLSKGQVEYQAQGKYTGKQDVTLYAVWEAKKYHISYDFNKGTANGQNFNDQEKIHNGSAIYIYDYIPARENYVFVGWGETAESTDPLYHEGDLYWENADRKLYAIWTPELYSIQYITNGANEVINTEYKTSEDTNFHISSVIPTKDGFQFNHWEDTNKKIFNVGDIYTENENLMLTAEYDSKKYTVTFKAGENAQISENNKIVEYEKPYGELPQPTKTDYEFVGWYTQDGKLITDQSIFTEKNDQELFAKWASTVYHVYYNANKGTGEPEPQVRRKGEEAITIAEGSGMTRENHTFEHWEDANGKQYKPGEKYSEDKDLTLYAIWNPGSIKITYDANGGTGAPEPYWKEKGETYILSTQIPIKEGFTFKGWGLTDNAKEEEKITKYSEDEDVTVYAIWEEKTIEIRYNILNGTNQPENQIKYWTQDLKLTDVIPEKTGYKFLGWSTKTNGNKPEDVEYEGSSMLTSNDVTVLYAVWELQNCTLTYDANGGNGGPEKQNLKYGEKIQIGLTIPMKVGYNFIGWGTLSSDTTPTYNVGSDYTIYEENAVLYAIWEAKTFTVTYNANGGKNAPGTQKKVYGQDLLLSSVKPTRQAYAFIGWAEEKDASEAKYASGAENGYYTTDDNITLYAVWKRTGIIEKGDELYLESSVYNILKNRVQDNLEKGYLTKVPTNTTLTEFINNCETNGIIEVFRKDGTKVQDNEIIGTGMTIKVTKEGSEESIELEIAVTGDLDGDGQLTVNDLSTMISHHTGAYFLQGIYYMAGDMDNTMDVTMSDLSAMINELTT